MLSKTTSDVPLTKDKVAELDAVKVLILVQTPPLPPLAALIKPDVLLTF